LSLKNLGYLLEKTFDTQIPFATPEFNIWKDSLIKATRRVVQNETIVRKILNEINEISFSVCNTREAESASRVLLGN